MRIFVPILALFILTACDGAIKDYVGGATPAAPTPQPSTELPASGAVRLSPGYMKATDQGVGMEANITTTKKVVSGGGISAELTMGRSRSQ